MHILKQAPARSKVIVLTLVCLLLTLITSNAASAEEQAPEIEWIRKYGTPPDDDAQVVAVGPQGEVYVAGWTEGALPGQTSAGKVDAFLRKYDPDGNEMWTRQFGSLSYDEVWGVAVGPQGEVYVSGGAEDPLPGQTDAGWTDAFLRKYDPDGNEMWTRQFGTSGYDYARGVAVGPQGEVYVAGRVHGALPGQTYAGGTDVFLRKYDPDGNEMWTRQFGSLSIDYAWGVAVGAQGEVYVAGWTHGALPGQTSAGMQDAFLRKYDPDGNEMWTHQFGSLFTDYARGVAVGAQGEVYVAGWTHDALPGETSAGRTDAFLRKYDLDGNEMWTCQFGSLFADYARGVAVGPQGEIYVSGGTGSALPGQQYAGDADAFLDKYDPDGNEMWTRQFGSSSHDWTPHDNAHGVAVGPQGEIYVSGMTAGALPGQTSAGRDDAFLRKYDPDGNEMWTRQFGARADPPEVNIVEPADGDVVYDKVRITAEVSDVDDDPLTVSFLINDVVIHTVELTDTVFAQDVPYIWDTFPSYEDGSYEVSVTASDGIFTTSDSIEVVLKNRVIVVGEIVAFVAGPTPDLPIAGASLQLILDGEVQYSFITDENGRYSFENVEPNLPGERYDRIVLKNGVVLDIHSPDRTVHYNPGVDELEEVIRIKNYAAAGGSPIDLHVYDIEGRHTGLIDGEIELGIPLSWYSGDTEPEVIVILNPAYVYELVVFGEESGTFDLQVSNYILIDSEDTIVTINLNDVSIATGDEMPFTYDFAEIEEEINMLLNEGYSIEDAVEDVVNSIDSDGDGLVDGKEIEIGTNPLNVDSDGDMWNDAADMSPTNAIIPNVFIAGVVAAVVVAVYLARARSGASKG